MGDYETLGRAIRDEREARGWSQTDLGWRIGTTANVVYKIENGTRPVRALELAELANAFDCTADELLKRGEAPPPEVLVERAGELLDAARRASYRYAWAVARAAWAVDGSAGPVRLEDGTEIADVAGLAAWLGDRKWVRDGEYVNRQPLGVPVEGGLVGVVRAAAALSDVPAADRVLESSPED